MLYKYFDLIDAIAVCASYSDLVGTTNTPWPAATGFKAEDIIYRIEAKNFPPDTVCQLPHHPWPGDWLHIDFPYLLAVRQGGVL